LLAAVFVLAVLIRWPHLWQVPRFTDELQEVLWSIAIWRGEMLPLTAVDSYYGPLWSYLLAGLFVLFGPSPELPRLTALLFGAGFVLLTYGFARDLAGRWPAVVAAGLLLTSGGHVIINSHTARSNSITPILTTAAIWLLFRALATRSWDWPRDRPVPRRPEPRLLAPAGLLLGLALQTHLSVIAVLPGLLCYGLLRGRALLRTPWPYVGGLGLVLGYSNMLIYNLLNDFWSFRHARSLQQGYADGQPSDLEFVLTNLANLLQSLSRLLSGTIDVADNPIRFLYLGLALVGLALSWRRGGEILGLATLSMVVVLPLFNPRYGPILSGRYLIPLLPLCFTAIGCLLVLVAVAATRRWRPAGRWQSTWAVAATVLVVYPLWPLAGYYDEVLADRRTNSPLYTLAGAVEAARAPDEIVLLDEGLGQEALGAGGTDLKAMRMLLETRQVPYVVGKVGDLESAEVVRRGSLLLVAEAKKRSNLPRAVRTVALSPEVESASGSEHVYAVYRALPR
jgi:4-amino-4-deoxy-L-arabinose transferase-like glycosyltransferase